ncbi:alpha/beta-hydrolase [Daedaleopsis nitida]|nr:alpha/beta-hydrolase [Daedaleopsis nitida]
MDPSNYKDVKVSRGYTYHYYYAAPAPGKPTLFFIHGFPSSSFDWSRQVAHFKPKGYGLLIPDTLGYGGTSKPTDYEEFRWKLQARDLMDVLDAEKPELVVGIGHDWGSSLLSSIANDYQDRFAGFVWIALSYIVPGPEPFDLDKTLEALKQHVGSNVYGYWAFFNQADAHVKCEQNIDSFLQLLYADKGETWLEWFCPVGKAQEWIESDRKPGPASWMTEHEYATMREKLLQGGLQSAMSFYKVYIRNVNLEDQKALPEEKKYIKKPALFIAATRDFVCRADFGKAIMQKYAPQAEIVEVDTGHWAQLEGSEHVSNHLEKWLGKLAAA